MTTDAVNGTTIRTMTAREFHREYGFDADFSRMDGDDRPGNDPHVSVLYAERPDTGRLVRIRGAYTAHQAQSLFAGCVPTREPYPWDSAWSLLVRVDA